MSMMIAAFFYIIAPVTDMREEPADNARMASQVYFSENVQILEEKENWLKIKNCVDGYVGWIKKAAICSREMPFLSDATKLIAKVNRCCSHLYDREDTEWGPILSLPFESRLQVLDPLDPSSTSRWLKVALPDGRELYIQRGDVVVSSTTISRQEMLILAKRFLELPYTFGGRSSFGYDCSGFVQMLYRQMGIFIPRDSRDQIHSPLFRETSLENLAPGDLIFFGLDANSIRHTGMYLGDNKFIHTSPSENAPWIRIYSLSSSEWNGSGRYKYLAFRSLT